MRYKNILLILSVVLAVVLPLGAAIKANIVRASSPVIQVKITTYDPRDLFYGQYMTYRFDWNWKDGAPKEDACQGEDCCLCVGEGNIDPEVSLAACTASEENKECQHLIKGRFYGMSFDPGFNRYYVDERHAYPLEQLFRQGTETFRIGLGLPIGGKAILERLYINDQSLEEYLSAHDGEIPLLPNNP